MKIETKFISGKGLCLDIETPTSSGGPGDKGPAWFVQPAQHPASPLMYVNAEEDNLFKELISKSYRGLGSGYSPTLCDEGVGGTYFLRDDLNRPVGVFKPHDEEMGSLNNPKGFTPKSEGFSLSDSFSKRGVSAGEAAFRECAAYLLDHGHFSGVPATDLVVCRHPSFSSPNSPEQRDLKVGSLQEFKEHDFNAEDLSPSKAAKFPTKEVHKIAVLDIRLFNTDRHGGNILVKEIHSPQPGKDLLPATRLRSNSKLHISTRIEEEEEIDMQFDMECDWSDEEEEIQYIRRNSVSRKMSIGDFGETYQLIPIDHGYALPTSLSGLCDSWFEWLYWPQAKQPFDAETREYVSKLDADKDVSLLKEKFCDWMPTASYRILRITTMWLKKCVSAGLSPHDIGTRMCRKLPDQPSELENMVSEAELAVVARTDNPSIVPIISAAEENLAVEAVFLEELSNIMDCMVANIVPPRAPTTASTPASNNNINSNNTRCVSAREALVPSFLLSSSTLGNPIFK